MIQKHGRPLRRPFLTNNQDGEIKMQQQTPEWYEARKGRITASSVGAIMGVSPLATPADVMRRMVREYHGAESEFTGNVATEYGNFHEAGAAAEFEMETGLKVEPCGFYVHPTYNWLDASPDGLVGDNAIIEIKCPYGQAKKDKPEFKTLDEQQHYKLQILTQLACSGRTTGIFYQWAPNGTAPIENLFYIDWSYYFETEVIPVLWEFYKQYLIERELPNAEKHLEDKRLEITSMDAVKLTEEYFELTDAIDRANERKKDILNKLVETSKGRNADINGHLLTKVERAGSVSYAKAIAAYAPDADLEPFRGKPSHYWRFL